MEFNPSAKNRTDEFLIEGLSSELDLLEVMGRLGWSPLLAKTADFSEN